MTAPTPNAASAPFTEYARAGYLPHLLPVIPPGAMLSPGSKLDPATLGKVPGQYLGNGQWCGMPGWTQRTPATMVDVQTWTKWPGAGLCLRTGELIAFDIDVSSESFAEGIEHDIVALAGPTPVRYGRAPRRLLVYRIAEPVTKWRHPFGGEAVEALCSGGQFIAEGIHPRTGQPYSWRDGRSLAAVPLNDLPVLSLDQFRQITESLSCVIGIFADNPGQPTGGVPVSARAARRERTEADNGDADPATLEDVQAALDAIPNEERHWEDWNTVGLAVWAACGPVDGSELFDTWSQKSWKYDPAGTQDRWEHYARSPPDMSREQALGVLGREARQADPAFRLPSDDARCGFSPLSDDGPDVPEQETEWEIEQPKLTEHPTPLDLFSEIVAAGHVPMPAGALPAVIEAFACDEARRLGVDPAPLALACIVVASAAAHGGWRIQPKQHDPRWTEAPRLWGGLIGGPGTKKSPIIAAALRPLTALEREWAEMDAPAEAAYKLEEEVYQKKRTGYVAKTAKGEAAEKPVEPVPPRRRRKVVQDVTIEKLGDILMDNEWGVLAVEDELVGWIASFDAYRDGRGTGKDRAAWLELYNGGRRAVDRVRRGSAGVPNWSACLLGGIQPEVIGRLAGKLADDGLLQRFIFAHVPESDGSGEDRVPEWPAVDAYRDVIGALAEMPAGETPITLSVEAQAERAKVEALAGAVMALPTTPAAFKGHLLKWPGLFARLCLVFHLIDAAGAVTDDLFPTAPPVLSAETARRVAKFMQQYLLPNAAGLYALAGSSPATDHARWVAGYILARGCSEISSRDIGRAYRQLREDTTARQRTTDILVTAGWLDPVTQRPGQPATKWAVNPLVHTLFADRAEQERQRRESERHKIELATRRMQDLGSGAA